MIKSDLESGFSIHVMYEVAAFAVFFTIQLDQNKLWLPVQNLSVSNET